MRGGSSALPGEMAEEHLAGVQRGRLLAGELGELSVLRVLELKQDAVLPTLLDR